MISAVILTKNEELNIAKCLDSLSWCDEKIVIDDNSEDKTVEIAKKKGAKVYSHSLDNDFSAQRNFGLEKAKGDWILFVDGDEVVSPGLWYEIMQLTNDPIDAISGYYLRRRDTVWGKELHHGEVGSIKLLRLARSGAEKWSGKVHEEWKVKGKTAVLRNILHHYPHASVGEFLSKINFYTSIRAKELYDRKILASWWSIIIFPTSKFALNYFFKGGFFDGLTGLVFAMMMSFHSFLVRGKLWLLWQKKEKSK